MASARPDARWQALLSLHPDHAAQSLRLLCDSDAALWTGKSPSALCLVAFLGPHAHVVCVTHSAFHVCYSDASNEEAALLVHAAAQLQRSASPVSHEVACAALLRLLHAKPPRVSHAVTCSTITLLVRVTHPTLSQLLG